MSAIPIQSNIYSKFSIEATLKGQLDSVEEFKYNKSEEQVLETVANVRYYHQNAAWDSPLSFGVQAFVEYNGLVMNDRYQSDLIRVTGITGLDDAEVRDSREPRAGESGEYVYDAFYGGRNLVLNGFIEAGTIQADKILEKNLKAAFAPLVESPLKFRWFDIYDPFDDPRTIQEYNPRATVGSGGNYMPVKGSLKNLTVANGLLSWNTPSNVYLIRVSEQRAFCDAAYILKCTKGQKDNSSIGFLPCTKNEFNYCIMQYEENNGEPKLTISTVNNGERRSLISEVIPPSIKPIIGQSFWIRGIKEGSLLSLQYWNTIPSETILPSFSISTYLTGEDENNYGDEILSQVGIAGNQANTLWSFDEFKIESMYPGDVQFMARKASSLSIKDEQTSLTKFKRPFQIVMKTSEFRALSSAEITKSIEPINIESSLSLGRSYPRKYPLRYKFFTSSTLPLQSNLLSINNRGSAYTDVVMYLYGPGENILIENLTNEQSLQWNGKIEEGDYLVFDCKEKTLVNSLGTNFEEPLSSNLEWIRLEPMWNDIYIQGTGFNSNTKFIIKTRYGYM